MSGDTPAVRGGPAEGAPGPSGLLTRPGRTDPDRDEEPAELDPASADVRWRDARASLLCLILTAFLGAVAVLRRPEAAVRADVLTLAGLLAIGSLVSASLRLRAQRAHLWTHQRDPFLALAFAVVILLAPNVLPALVDGPPGAIGSHTWVTSSLAAALGAVGFLIVIRDLTPRRTIDALFLAAIGAMAGGLAAWVAILQLVEAEVIATRPAVALLAPMVLDLVVVGLGIQALRLRARARHGFTMLLAGWTCLLALDFATLLAGVADTTLSASVTISAGLAVSGLLASGALHPDATRPTEPVFGAMRRLPRSQVALLGGAVLLGPLLLAFGLEETGPLAIVIPLSGAVSLLVVTYLVRLVQGRAVLEHRAHHDELTGLANLRLFHEQAEVALAHAQRAGTHSAVLYLDLDRFKNVNDSLGHAVGNLLLQAVAKRLRSATRAEDTVARLGGDEFVVFLPQLEHPEEATVVAAKILERFTEPFTLTGHQLFASPSIGIAVFPDDGADAGALLENADVAMYRAKQRGRRTFCAYDASMNDHAHERLKLESQLHRAVERGELRLHYQPKIHLPTGRVMGMEALLRWQHPELGLLQPAAFIELAEESGLIVPMGEWALTEACRQNKAWVDAGFQPLTVAVNLSLRQFQQQQIGDVVARVLRATGMDPTQLELEVTESLVMQNPEDVCAELLDLKALGVKCSIDDFGTGYSGLSHLTVFPIDKLKIDRSFVATIESGKPAPIVVAVVALAHGLGLEAVAEGVETTEQLERLQQLGCDEMQGYLFSRPLTPERFEQLLMLEAISPGPGRLVPLGGAPHLVHATG